MADTLGVKEIDADHREFLALLKILRDALAGWYLLAGVTPKSEMVPLI